MGEDDIFNNWNYRIYSDINTRINDLKGEEFYRYIFSNNQDEGEMTGDYSKPNAIYLYKNPKDEGTER